MKIPIFGKLNKNQSLMLTAGVAGLGILAFLAYTGRRSGISFLDESVEKFGSVTKPYGFPVAPVLPKGGGIVPMQVPPVSPKTPTVAEQAAAGMLIPSGPGIDRLQFNQGISMAPEPYPPSEYMFSGSYFGDYEERDLITVA